MLLLLQHLLPECQARSHEFGDSPLDKCPGKFRVLKLVADGNLVPGPDELCKVQFYGVMGETGHCHVSLVPVGTLREDDSEDLAGQYGIVRIGLVEVPDPVEKDGLRVLGLHIEILLQ